MPDVWGSGQLSSESPSKLSKAFTSHSLNKTQGWLPSPGGSTQRSGYSKFCPSGQRGHTETVRRSASSAVTTPGSSTVKCQTWSILIFLPPTMVTSTEVAPLGQAQGTTSAGLQCQQLTPHLVSIRDSRIRKRAQTVESALDHPQVIQAWRTPGCSRNDLLEGKESWVNLDLGLGWGPFSLMFSWDKC